VGPLGSLILDSPFPRGNARISATPETFVTDQPDPKSLITPESASTDTPTEDTPTETTPGKTSPAEPSPSEPAAAPADSAPTTSAPTHDDFAKLLAASTAARRYAKGAVVRGTVVQIGDTDVLVDVGAKSEAMIAKAELVGEDGVLAIQVGDSLEGTVMSVDGSIRLSRKLVASSRSKEMLMEAFKNGMPVQGRVTASIKGGYEVQVAGVRGFCPFSQIDLRRQEDPNVYFNKTFVFQIKEYEPRKRNLIVSRRALLEAEQKKQEAEVRSRITEGAVLSGTVVSLMDFGAFIDLGGGVQGLLHVSEISHARVAKPSDVLTHGQTLDVQVLRIDAKKGKISLTRKPLEGDPWSGVAQQFQQGQVLSAKVVRVTEFGAFVELAPGVDGLLHVSEMAGMGGSGSRKAADLAKSGDEINVQVMKVDEGKRRISLGLVQPSSSGVGGEKGDRRERDAKGERGDRRERAAKGERGDKSEKVVATPVKVGDVVTGKVDRVEKFGVFIRFGVGRSGMVPNSELGTQRGADHRKMFPAGTELKAEVIEADAAGRKIRLSVTKAMTREEREAVERYRKDTTKSGGTSFSTMADAFAALKKSSPRDGESG